MQKKKKGKGSIRLSKKVVPKCELIKNNLISKAAAQKMDLISDIDSTSKAKHTTQKAPELCFQLLPFEANSEHLDWGRK